MLEKKFSGSCSTLFLIGDQSLVRHQDDAKADESPARPSAWLSRSLAATVLVLDGPSETQS